MNVDRQHFGPRQTRRARSLTVIALSTIAATVATTQIACSLLLNGSADQCATDADCQGGWTCGPQGVCVEPARIVTGDDDAGDTCVTHDECVARNGQRPAICPSPGGQCLNIVTDDCPEVVGKYRDPNAIFVASFFPTNFPNGDLNAFFQAQLDSIDLAFSEIDSTVTGLPNGGASTRRPLVSLHCNPTPNGMTHAADVVKVPAAFVANEAVGIPFFANFASRNNIWVGCPMCVWDFRKVNAGTGDVSLAFGILSNFGYQIPLMVKKTRDVETKIRADRGISDSTPLKLVNIVNGYIGSSNFADEFERQRTSVGTVTFVRKQYPDATTTEVNFPAFVDEVVLEQPALITMSALFEQVTVLIPLIEQKWPAGIPRPHYILNASGWSAALPGVIGDNEDLRQRVLGVKPTPLVTEFNEVKGAFDARYTAKFPRQAPPYTYAYDGAYALAMAITAASPTPGGKVNGADIVRGIPRINTPPPAPEFLVGPSNLGAALASLANGPIKLTGIFSPLNFDMTTGAVPIDSCVFCVGHYPDMSLGLIPVAGETYDWATQTPQGTFSCP